MSTQFKRTDNTKKRVVAVEFKTEPNDYPDPSWLGEYGDSAKSDYAIDRKERGDCGRREFPWFNPNWENYRGESEDNVREYCERDYQRMEDYNRGGWCMLYCHAVATVSINGVEQEVTSGGLGGVESDAGKDYIEEIKEEEFNALRGILKSMGFRADTINIAIGKAKENV